MDITPQGDQPNKAPNPREWMLLEKVVLEAFTEQRRARRWSVFFKLLTFGYLIVLLRKSVVIMWPSCILMA